MKKVLLLGAYTAMAQSVAADLEPLGYDCFGHGVKSKRNTINFIKNSDLTNNARKSVKCGYAVKQRRRKQRRIK